MMTGDTTTSQSTVPAARPSRVGQYVVAAVCVVATAMAFTIAYITTDHTLAPNQRLAMEQVRRMEGFFKMYQRTMGRFPPEQVGFAVLIEGRVIESVPVDPWGRPYVYLFNNEHTGVVSYGADGVPGGEGENADISSGGLVRLKQ
jgi:general secretion pathway protein G